MHTRISLFLLSGMRESFFIKIKGFFTCLWGNIFAILIKERTRFMSNIDNILIDSYAAYLVTQNYFHSCYKNPKEVSPIFDPLVSPVLYIVGTPSE